LAGRVEAGKVLFREGKGGGNICRRLQGVLDQHTADDRFKVPLALDPAGYLQPGFVGKGDEVKGISQLKIIPQEGTAQVAVDLPVVGTHIGGSVQEQHHITGGLVLPKSPQRRQRQEDEANRHSYPFHAHFNTYLSLTLKSGTNTFHHIGIFFVVDGKIKLFFHRFVQQSRPKG
jgi:hypothetical protein